MAGRVEWGRGGGRAPQRKDYALAFDLFFPFSHRGFTLTDALALVEFSCSAFRFEVQPTTTTISSRI